MTFGIKDIIIIGTRSDALSKNAVYFFIYFYRQKEDALLVLKSHAKKSFKPLPNSDVFCGRL